MDRLVAIFPAIVLSTWGDTRQRVNSNPLSLMYQYLCSFTALPARNSTSFSFSARTCNMAAEQVPASMQQEEVTALAGDVGTKYKAAAEVVQKVRSLLSSQHAAAQASMISSVIHLLMPRGVYRPSKA